MIMHAIVPSSLVTGGLSYQTIVNENNIGAPKMRKNYGAIKLLSFQHLRLKYWTFL